jgi:hypothetical protein
MRTYSDRKLHARTYILYAGIIHEPVNPINESITRNRREHSDRYYFQLLDLSISVYQ